MKRIRKAQSEVSHSDFKKKKERERWISSQTNQKSKSPTSRPTIQTSKPSSESLVSRALSTNTTQRDTEETEETEVHKRSNHRTVPNEYSTYKHMFDIHLGKTHHSNFIDIFN